MKYRELIQLLERDGWRLDRQKGSHMQYRHFVQPGTVTVPAGGKTGGDVPAGTLNSILKQAGLIVGEANMKYVVVIEKSKDGDYWAYLPDLPGCISRGDTAAQAEFNIREAVEMHLESLREHGEPVPPPAASVTTVDAA